MPWGLVRAFASVHNAAHHHEMGFGTGLPYTYLETSRSHEGGTELSWHSMSAIAMSYLPGAAVTCGDVSCKLTQLTQHAQLKVQKKSSEENPGLGCAGSAICSPSVSPPSHYPTLRPAPAAASPTAPPLAGPLGQRAVHEGQGSGRPAPDSAHWAGSLAATAGAIAPPPCTTRQRAAAAPCYLSERQHCCPLHAGTWLGQRQRGAPNRQATVFE